ncbi:MAG: SRPBCC family protein [Polyangiaceae bacterium]
MSFVAKVSRRIEVPAQVVFDCLADHDAWPSWAPKTFRPVGKSLGRLTEGKAFYAKILGLPFPAKCDVTVVKSPVEITWCGGKKGLLYAEHRFLFEPKGDAAVEVTSAETWSGLLSVVLRAVIDSGAKKVGADQLSGLAAGAKRRFEDTKAKS